MGDFMRTHTPMPKEKLHPHVHRKARMASDMRMKTKGMTLVERKPGGISHGRLQDATKANTTGAPALVEGQLSG